MSHVLTYYEGFIWKCGGYESQSRKEKQRDEDENTKKKQLWMD